MRLAPLITYAAAAIMAAPVLMAQARPAPSFVAPARPAPTRVDVAPGVYLFQTAPYGDAGLDGNSVAIVGDDGVLVFDANGTPAAASAVLAQIRQITDKPVKYLVLSHWHWDHWYGAEVYRAAFPKLEIIAHERTRALMAGPAVVFNQPGLDEQLPGHIAQVEAALARSTAAADSNTARLQDHVANDRWFLEQKRTVLHTLPTRTLRDSLTLRLGTRVVKVMHHDRAITPGDVFLWLPDERIAVTGDLLINPITFALFCYPSGWIATLHHLDSLGARVMIPGHGAPLTDPALLRATSSLLEREVVLAREQKAAGRTAADATKAILADSAVLALRDRITSGVVARNDAFALYLVEWFVKRVYQEIDGTLDDSIPSAP